MKFKIDINETNVIENAKTIFPGIHVMTGDVVNGSWELDFGDTIDKIRAMCSLLNKSAVTIEEFDSKPAKEFYHSLGYMLELIEEQQCLEKIF